MQVPTHYVSNISEILHPPVLPFRLTGYGMGDHSTASNFKMIDQVTDGRKYLADTMPSAQPLTPFLISFSH